MRGVSVQDHEEVGVVEAIMGIIGFVIASTVGVVHILFWLMILVLFFGGILYGTVAYLLS